jgi:hypothetical protein
MAALARLGAVILGVPETIPEAWLARWPELATARWRRGGLPPMVPQWWFGEGSWTITLGRTVFLGPAARLDPELLLHEVRHVQQFGASPLFALRYLWELVRHGYHDNPYEADARRYARERLAAPVPAAARAPADPSLTQRSSP